MMQDRDATPARRRSPACSGRGGGKPAPVAAGQRTVELVGSERTLLARAPSPALAPCVAALAYYEARVPDGRELVLPTGAMMLVVSLAEDQLRYYDGDGCAAMHTRRGAVLLSASAGPIGTDLPERCAVVVVLFRPGGAYPFFVPPAAAIDEPLVELEELWGRDGAVLRERLLAAPTPQAVLSTVEDVLVARAVRSMELDPAVAAAVAALDRGVPVAAVAERLGLSDRTLLRRFCEKVGLAPKRFARVRRLRCLLASLPTDREADREVDWARAAVEFGYFDQAHLIHEFRALTGLTPLAYRPRSALCRNHDLPSGRPSG